MVEVVVDGAHLGVEEEVQATKGAPPVGSIPWLVTSVGCMAIWPVTIPAPVTRQRVVAALVPLEKVHRDPAIRPKERKRLRKESSFQRN